MIPIISLTIRLVQPIFNSLDFIFCRLTLDGSIYCSYNIAMRNKRVRTKLFPVWLHQKELEFLNRYAEANMLTASELIRYWIRQAMEKEGLLRDVAIETKPKEGGK